MATKTAKIGDRTAREHRAPRCGRRSTTKTSVCPAPWTKLAALGVPEPRRQCNGTLRVPMWTPERGWESVEIEEEGAPAMAPRPRAECGDRECQAIHHEDLVADARRSEHARKAVAVHELRVYTRPRPRRDVPPVWERILAEDLRLGVPASAVQDLQGAAFELWQGEGKRGEPAAAILRRRMREVRDRTRRQPFVLETDAGPLFIVEPLRRFAWPRSTPRPTWDGSWRLR
jgi:hypothetical protein